MIIEIAILSVKAGEGPAFERDFTEASRYISQSEGYVSHQLQRCLETKNRYILLVNWSSVEAHMVVFRNSKVFLEWKRLLHHYYDQPAIVEHYSKVYEGTGDRSNQ
jgi:heme-degrading monooxygenase HmoA